MYQINNKGFILKIRESRTFKGLAVYLCLTFLVEIIHPNLSLALTEGPSQPEVQSFEPVGTTQMVDLFTGDFNYNIPLFNLPGPNGGYPVNLAYHAGVSMDDEASWVGLGWNINAGSLVRSVRGLPDEFLSHDDDGDGNNEPHDSDGTASSGHDYLEVQTDMKESWTLGIKGGLHLEMLGADVLSGLDLSASVYYNNYRGMGISAGATLEYAGKFSTGVSLDTENGAGVSASLSHSDTYEGMTTKHTLSLEFDGDLTAKYSLQKNKRVEVNVHDEGCDSSDPGKDWSYTETGSSSFGNSFSFARNSFNPSLGTKRNNFNFSATIFGGVEAIIAHASGSLSLYYYTEDYSNEDKNGRKHMVAGYEKMAQNLSNKYTRDFSRTNDGQITKTSMFLPSSHFTYDVYNSTGQGLSGYFRPRRSDIGRSYDPFVRNVTGGASAGFEVGAGGLAKAGIDLGVNFGWSTQGPWDEENDFKNEFLDPATNLNIENFYYQAHGEQTILDEHELDFINGLELPFVRLTPKADDNLTGGKRNINGTSVANSDITSTRTPQSRVVRNTLIHSLQNHEVGGLGEFNVDYFANYSQVTGSPSGTLTRDKRRDVDISRHNAGYKILNAEGSYYVYALPAYNQVETENLFSVDDQVDPFNKDEVSLALANEALVHKINASHEFINKTTKSPYAHSFLLTSVQGADYVDVKNDGPTDDDLGYWVKFNYVKYADDYKWRAPYTKANYHQGAPYSTADDKGSYQYGEKEIWYLGRIETKSHVAVFKMSPRTDNREVEKELSNETNLGDHSGLQVDEIEVYEKKSFLADENAAVPLQVVHFEYDYSLAPGVLNNSAAGQGKLTLSKVWFTSNGSSRGTLSSYEFDYTKVGVSESITNPGYRKNAYDPWGTYKPIGANYEHHARLPYVNQFNQQWNDGLPIGEHCWTPAYTSTFENDGTRAITKETQDNLASAWCLRQIKLPSGGTINIDYESDDYGYVQHKTANQMFKITKLGDGMGASEVYNEDEDFDNDSEGEENRRIYFKLEYPIRVDAADPSDEVYKDYVEPLIQDEEGARNLYFKAKMRLAGNAEDYVSGYLPLEEYSGTRYGVREASIQTDGGIEYYTEGFVTLKRTRKKIKKDVPPSYYNNYHPMALAAWTYLQTDAQELLSNSGNLSSAGTINTPHGILNIVGDITSLVPATMSNFGAIRPYCKSQNFARFISRNNSCIRLASPDKIKYGGGHRVREISITDNWSADTGVEESRTYGQHYDYTIAENGKIISSGVTQYEPQAGGDENALKYPIHYSDKQTLASRNNLFAEAPLNESLFPGAAVGYRKVTVKSINTENQLKSPTTAEGRSGGITVHQFYTAKEFPTFTEVSILGEENSTKDLFNLPIIIPLIGSIRRNYYHGTQAYMIELNDMHGKPKSVESFELNGYVVNQNPITSSYFEYQSVPVQYQGESVQKLDNYVKIIANDNTHKEHATKRLMGVEYDLFTDQRQSKTFSNAPSLELNVDIPPIPIPALTFWMTYENHKTLFRTYVTNKVIHKTGILKKTKTRDLQTVNETEILAYDERSGQPVLSRMKNEFGDDFYSYNIPAYYVYGGMGHAYQNINFNFDTDITTSNPYADPNENTVDFTVDQTMIDHLVRGDELLITSAEEPDDLHKKGYFLGFKYNDSGILKGILKLGHLVSFESENQDITLKVIRSGRRNHHTATVANYLSKGRITDVALADHPVRTSLLDGNVIQTKEIADNVLSATASLYKQDWLISDATEFATENPFLSGNSGIWRPYKTYTYVGERSQAAGLLSDPEVDPVLYNDGVMSEVPMFSWEIGDIEEYIPNWEWVNEVTRYSTDTYETENRNRLGIYSSALYGYDNSLTIGVGGNASYYELGAIDFETAPADGIWKYGESMKQTNLNFFNAPEPSILITTDHYDIRSAKYLMASQELEAIVKVPFPYFMQLVNQGQYTGINAVTLNSTKNNAQQGNRDYYFNTAPGGDPDTKYGEVIIGGVSHTRMRLKLYVTIPNYGSNMLPKNTEYTGKISMNLLKINGETEASTTSFVSNKAHTGKKSMRINSDVLYSQFKLTMKKDKKYVLSMWVSRENTNVPTYKPATGNLFELSAVDLTTFGPISGVQYSYGKVVEGWQKVDAVFSVPDDLQNLVIEFKPGGQALFVDDVRYSPRTGGISTYVYDPTKFWLRASLNADNYATLFFYDEQGNLHLKKQETEKGIFTISESRGHVSED